MHWLIGLNSLRGIAIVLIVVYHLFRGVLSGGFVAVEMFFGISGFLIASKLLREHYAGGISYGKFIWTRLKRIFPTLFLCVLVTLGLGNFVDRDMMTGVRENTLGALTFSTNVVEIARGGSYEAELIPNVFGHTWFLGIEMQFYLLFPILLLLILPLFKKRRKAIKVVAAVCFGIGVVSMVLMVLYGVVFAAQDRAYFGLDSHVAALMLGAGVGAVYVLNRQKIKMPKVLATIGIAGSLGGIVAMSFLMNYNSALAFGVGLPLAAVLTMVMVLSVAALQRGLKRPRLLVRALERLGLVSFGLYLFHFPLYLLLPFLLPGMQSWVYPVATIAISLGLAILSHVFVESGRIFMVFQRMTRTKFLVAAAALAVLLYLPISTLMTAPEQSSIAEQLKGEEEKPDGVKPEEKLVVDFGGVSEFTMKTKEIILPYFASAAALALKPPSTSAATPSANYYTGNASVLVIGDSVTLGAKTALQKAIKNSYVDAKGSRFMYSAAGILASYKAQGGLPKVIVISLVTNYYNITEQMLANLVSVAGSGHDFIFVTAYAGPNQPREVQNNVLRNFAAKNSNVDVADWWAIAKDNWGYMYADRIHLQPAGRTAYANLIVQTIERIGR